MSLYSSDREVLETVHTWVGQGRRVVLATVVRTWGSSPRPLGSLLAMRDDGRFVGSVSGGCIEDDLVGRFVRGELSDAFPLRLDYGVDREDAVRHGLPCGGRLELVLERVDKPAPIQALLEHVQRGELVLRRVSLDTGEVQLERLDEPVEFCCDANFLGKTYGPSWSLLLVGAGELARYVAGIGLMLGYRITVCDPREETTDGWRMQGAELIRQMPDDAVRERVRNASCAVLTLAHDPKVDDMALMEALESPAFYVGALGSRRTSESRRARLSSLGLSEANLDRLHAPIGLPIGSRTPAEIALSIMAEVTAVRHRAPGRGVGVDIASVA